MALVFARPIAIALASALTLALGLATVAGAAGRGHEDAVGREPTLPDSASAVAKAVIAAIANGENPAEAAKKAAEEARAARTENGAENATEKAAAESGKPSGDTWPGWGCGDKNHTHDGPRGKGAEQGSPCDRNENR